MGSGRGFRDGGLYVANGATVWVEEGCEPDEVVEDRELVNRVGVTMPLPPSSRGSWMMSLHSELLQHILIYMDK